jgi:hypothetical protein
MRDGLNKYGKENERLRERGDWAVEQLRIAEAEGEHLRAHIATLEGSCPEYAKAGALQRLVVKHVAEIKRLRRENFDLKAKTHPSVVGIQEAEIERLRAELGGERCQECGHLYPDVYSVPDDEWARVTGKTDSSGLLCPSCFKLRSHSLHLLAMHKDSMRMLQESVAEIKRLKAAIEAISAHHQLGLHSDTWGPIARQALEEGK